MTLEKQVQQLQMRVDTMARDIVSIREVLEQLSKDSHPPVDIVNCIKEAISSGTLALYRGDYNQIYVDE